MSHIISPTGMGIRVDRGGDGHYGTKRTRGTYSYIHPGLDFFCRPGQDIVAPDHSIIVRAAFPYEDDLNWKGALLRCSWCDIMIFYVVLFLGIGVELYRGQPFAKAQDISLKYPDKGVSSHVHLEIRSIQPNPEHFLEGV